MAQAAEPTPHDPWLVAAWPGMGSVALGAAGLLVDQLGARPVQTIVRREYFDITTVTIQNGVIQRSGPPASILHAAPGAGRDLLIFVGEAQPTIKGYEFCHEILDLAAARGARRVVTFAAMATPVHPSASPRDFGAATDAELRALLHRHDVALLSGQQQISGLNGVLLGAAAERGMEGFCLLGELPFFAAQIPSPKASLAVLRAFERISGVHVDLSKMEEAAEEMERRLVAFLEAATRQQEGQAEAEKEEGEDEGAKVEEAFEAAEEAATKPRASPAVRRQIDELFRQARQDRSKALALKALLDRHGLFREYEDRFLDLFKKDQHG